MGYPLNASKRETPLKTRSRREPWKTTTSIGRKWKRSNPRSQPVLIAQNRSPLPPPHPAANPRRRRRPCKTRQVTLTSPLRKRRLRRLGGHREATNTRSHPELGREDPQRRWYCVLRRGRVGRCQAIEDPVCGPYLGAGWSSPVARQAHNLKVAGSNPAPATKSARQFRARAFRTTLRSGALIFPTSS